MSELYKFVGNYTIIFSPDYKYATRVSVRSSNPFNGKFENELWGCILK